MALPPVGNTPYFVTVRKNSDIDLEIAAKLAEMPLDEFKALNPSFNRPVIRGDHAPTLLLPADRVEIFNANLTNYKGRPERLEGLPLAPRRILRVHRQALRRQRGQAARNQ